MARKAKKTAKRATKKTGARKSVGRTPARKAAKRTASKKTAKKSAKRAVPARKASAKKTARKTTARKATRKTTTKPDTDVKGEGNYSASRRFRDSEEAFIGNNRKRIPGMARNAEEALDSREGDDLKAAEAETRARGEGMDVETQ